MWPRVGSHALQHSDIHFTSLCTMCSCLFVRKSQLSHNYTEVFLKKIINSLLTLKVHYRILAFPNLDSAEHRHGFHEKS